MLTIKRVATVVSNYQEDASPSQETPVPGCGRNCLANCCLPVSALPLYAFKKNEDAYVERSPAKCSTEELSVSFLDNLLLGKWEEKMKQGLFSYDVMKCETKVISGKYGFIAQLNEGRHLKKRPTEFRIDQVLQPFDENKFNFTKVGQEEVLFRFEPGGDNESHFFPSFPIDADSTPNIVAINVSPIEYGHVLLIPHVLDCLPQRIDHDNLLLALYMANEVADPFFRLGYNSLGAFATINHLHFQAYHLNVPFPVQKALTQRIWTDENSCDSGIILSELLDYPVRGLVFELANTLSSLSGVVAKSCISLQNNNIPFNVLITDCGRKVYLFPQCYAEKQALGEVSQELLDTMVNPAVWEISGHMVLKRRKDYDDASEDYAWRLLTEVSLSEERFQGVKKLVLEAADLHEVGWGETNIKMEEDLHSPSAPKVASQIAQDCLFLR